VLDRYGSPKHKNKKDAVAAAAKASINKLTDELTSMMELNFSNPIIRMVSLLPKDELANLAESLVALTSLKRRVSNELETVGGAIDVALISKSDGFVWIKRKQYFSSELNPQFDKFYLDSCYLGDTYGRELRTKTDKPERAAEASAAKGSRKANSRGTGESSA